MSEDVEALDRVKNAMDPEFDFLSPQEISQIRTLIAALENSSLDYLQIETENLKIILGRGGLEGSDSSAAKLNLGSHKSEPQKSVDDELQSAKLDATLPSNDIAPELGPDKSDADHGASVDTTPIIAPMMGRFYGKPDPDAEEFVQMGSLVGKEDTVCLIEVMKVFNAVPAGIEGVVVEICAEDGQYVEYGQVLFRVKTSDNS